MSTTTEKTIKGPLSPRIQEAGLAAEKAISLYRNVVENEQAACKHHKVLHQEGGAYFTSGSWHDGRRICAECGFEETSRYDICSWSGCNSKDGYTTNPKGSPLKLTSEFVKKCGGEILSYRPRWLLL